MGRGRAAVGWLFLRSMSEGSLDPAGLAPTMSAVKGVTSISASLAEWNLLTHGTKGCVLPPPRP